MDSMAFADRWLAVWMDWVEAQVSDRDLAIDKADTNQTVPDLDLNHTFYVSVYSLAAASFLFFLLMESASFMLGGIRSSRTLHYRCLNTLMHAPVSWFDSTPKGRILSRFSADLSIVDLFLPRYLDWAAQFLFTVVVLCVVVVLVLPWMVPVLLFSLSVFVLQLAMACRITRDAKRDANNAMSPVQSTLAEIQQGLNKSARRFVTRQPPATVTPPYPFYYLRRPRTHPSPLHPSTNMSDSSKYTSSLVPGLQQASPSLSIMTQGGCSYVLCASNPSSLRVSCRSWTSSSVPRTLAPPYTPGRAL